MQPILPALSSPSLNWRTITIGALIWGVVMATSAYTAPMLRGWGSPANFMKVVLLFGVGGVIAFPIGISLANWLSKDRSCQTRVATALLGLGIGTVGVTALLYVIDYSNYYSEWHEPAFTKRWVLEVLITSIVALYQFAALGMRLFFPLGFCALFAAVAWFSRLPH